VPEGLEAEIYRRAAERVVGRAVAAVEVDDRQAMAGELRHALPGRTVMSARRCGKLVVLDLDDTVALGLHFGMTGRLIVDGFAPIDELVYASGRDDPAWNRLVLTFTDGTLLRVNDPRRWAAFTLDPDVERLGPDFLDLSADLLGERLRGRRAAVKTLLLDQTIVAGFGNLCIDEVLFQAGVAPGASVAELTHGQLGEIAAAARRHLPAMLERGGSHTGVLTPVLRALLPPCPRDGAPLQRSTVGGRTTVWCPVHQIV